MHAQEGVRRSSRSSKFQSVRSDESLAVTQRSSWASSTSGGASKSRGSLGSIPPISLESLGRAADEGQTSARSSWNDSLSEGDFDDLRRAISNVHPHLQFSHEVDPKAEAKALYAQLNPARRFNALLVAGDTAVSQPRGHRTMKFGPQVVPRIVVVTGHRGVGGNAGLNGVYERYPDDYQGRPVYQKLLEKRDAPEFEEPVCRSRHEWCDRSYGTRVLMQRDQKVARRHGSVPDLAGRPPEIRAAKHAYFLFFAHDQGCWCIGPRIGSGEVFARCPSADDPVPSGLFGWQVFDVDLKVWYSHKSLQAVKGGSTASFGHGQV